MDLIDISNNRLFSQQIADTKFNAVKDIVGWMGAMQAQDYEMVKWAIGIRLLNTTGQTIETAISNGEVIRTHLLRPTWHLVSADDISWMLGLTAPKIKNSLRSRHRELELSEAVFSKSNGIIEKALQGGEHLTRQALIVEFEKAGIDTTDNRVSHLLLRAELDGIVCSGASRGGKQTYALLEERVPKTKPLTKVEALAKLARKYFASHYPATIQDFIWWSGLSVGNAKQALETIKSDFTSEIISSQLYWFPHFSSIRRRIQESVYLLPAYDEFLISYKDRSASLPFRSKNKTVSNNGIFRPVIVVNGQVAGIWKRAIKKDKVLVETEMFDQPGKTTKSLIEKAAIQYGQFLSKEIEIRHKST